ncbi:MAG: hypothetical protein AAFX03_10925 [Pseudomonadota bacterium]
MGLRHAGAEDRVKRLALAAAALALAACGGPRLGDPAFALHDCARHALIDADTGLPIVGAEDLAAHPDGRRVYVSAYDRLAVEAAVEAGDPAPDGGLYVVDPMQLSAASSEVRSIIASPSKLVIQHLRGLRPHGIAVSGDRLAMVNRLQRPGGALYPAIQQYEISGGAAELIDSRRSDTYCAANDLAFDGDGLVISLDRKKCPGWAFDERVLGVAKGRLVFYSRDGREEDLVGGLKFANGVEVLSDGRFAVAETRRNRIYIREPDGSGRRLKTPGGADNLTLAPDGRLIAALHPDLIRLGRYRYGHRDTAPSRVIALDPDTGDIELLFEDRSGETFSGATAAVLMDGLLVVGSVRDAGLLVCRKAPA